MEYSAKFRQLKALFDTGKKQNEIPGSGITIMNGWFCSDDPEFFNENDICIQENKSFSYPVFAPAGRESGKVILLLHGLNERSWIKYLAWAFYLSELTGSWVILFPIAFHVNRSPDEWKDPRKMMSLLKDKKGSEEMSSFANAAISKRLTEDPMRFFFSGYRTVADIVKLLKSIREGKHDIIPRSSSFNIFSYSIGAFIAEIIMMANPMNLFSESKLFILCGGSVFSNMQGTSKLIMDKSAFEKVHSFYLNDFETIIAKNNPRYDFLNSDRLGLSFRSMIGPDRMRSFRESRLGKLLGRLQATVLVDDHVIPLKGILETLGPFKRSLEIKDFPYQYTHENPFPFFDNPLSIKVDSCFESIMTRAAEFFCSK